MTDLRTRQLQLQVSPKFTRYDALLVLGVYWAVVFGLIVAWLS